MILFFPQWQGAGQGQRLDRPARVLFDRIGAAYLPPRSHGDTATVEIPVDTGDKLTLENGIWGKPVQLDQLRAARDRIERHAPERLAVIGGDCGIETACIPYLSGKYGHFALIWIDAHADLNTPETSPSGTFHGMPLRVLMGEGDPDFTALVPEPLASAEVVMVGVRELDPGERDHIERHSMINFPVGTPELTRQLAAHLHGLGVRNIYIHFDLDALDPQLWPFMHYPAANGFSVEAIADVLHGLDAAFNIVGMSITEYASPDGGGLDTLAPVLEFFARLSQR